MTRLIAAIVLIAGLAPAAVHAAGVNLAWDACLSEGGAGSRSFACNTNSGTREIIGSFVPAQSHANLIAAEMYFYLQSSSATVPDWWRFGSIGTCRQNNVTMNTNFTTFPQTMCQDPWLANTAVSNMAYTTPSPDMIAGPNTARVVLVAALPSPGGPVTGGTEYYAFRLNVTNAKTIGTGSCTGCDEPMSLLFGRCVLLAEVNGAPQEVEVLTTPGQSNCISWQGGSALCMATPARNRTWGTIKGLYR